MASSNNEHGAGTRLQQPPSPTLRRGHSYGATSTADPTPLASPPARSPSSRSFDMARLASSRPAHLEEVLDMDVGSFRVPSLRRSPSAGSAGLSRGNTLRRNKSQSRQSSGSPSGARAGSISGGAYDKSSAADHNDVFYTPIPTNGSPTELLANRFQTWRRFLKELIGYFKEVQASYEQRSRSLSKLSNAASNVAFPIGFLAKEGISDALHILDTHHAQAQEESAKAQDIEIDVIAQLTGLRADLGQKIKEIRSLSGDFRNTVEKEMEATRKIVAALQDSLAAVDTHTRAMVGKEDPLIIRLAVERQIERQIEEENYLHRAYLNLEGSGRELEAIVVVEIQKAFSAFATILKAEGDYSVGTAEALMAGPVSIPKDLEWSEFIEKDSHFVSQDIPLRQAKQLDYPGRLHAAAAQIRCGMLERKSKYLKSYSPGWFVLSPTHLHEFRSPEAVHSQSPIVSLYLPDQKLGAHSQQRSSSHKFILKGRQVGGLHRGHSWVFRAESYETMLAWYDDIKSLTEKTGEPRQRFVRGHGRNKSAQSARSVSSFETDDEADRTPYSPSTALADREPLSVVKEHQSPRPEPGGRFPSSVQLRQREFPLGVSPSSEGTELDQEASSTAAHVVILAEPAAPNGVRGVKRQGASHGLGVDAVPQRNGADTALAVPAVDEDERRVEQDGELYDASPLLAPTTAAQPRDPPRIELPPRVVSTGGGLKSRFTEVLESSVALSLPQQPIADPNAAHATASQLNNPQKPDVAVAVTGPSTSLSTKPSQPADDATASATQLLARMAAKKVVLAQEAEELSSSQDVPRTSPKKFDVDERGSPSMSRKTTDKSVSNFPIPGRFPRAFRS